MSQRHNSDPAAATATPGLPPLAADAGGSRDEKKRAGGLAKQRKDIKHFLQTEKRYLVKEEKDMQRMVLTSVESGESNDRVVLMAEEKGERSHIRRTYIARCKELFPDLSPSRWTSQAVTPTHPSSAHHQYVSARSMEDLSNAAGGDRGLPSLGSSLDSSQHDQTLRPGATGGLLGRPTLPPGAASAFNQELTPRSTESATESAKESAQTFSRWVSDAIQRERDLQQELMSPPREESKSFASKSQELTRSISDAKEAARKLREWSSTPRPSSSRMQPPPSCVDVGVGTSDLCPVKLVEVAVGGGGGNSHERASSPIGTPERPSPSPPPRVAARSAVDSKGREMWGVVEDAIQESMMAHQAAIAACDEVMQAHSAHHRHHHQHQHSNTSSTSGILQVGHGRPSIDWGARVSILINKVREEVNRCKQQEAAPNAHKKRARGRVSPSSERRNSESKISGIDADTFKALSTELRSCLLGLQEDLQARRQSVVEVEKMLMTHGRITLEAHERAGDILEKRCAGKGGYAGATAGTSSSPKSTTTYPPTFILSLWDEERGLRETWLRKASEVDSLFRRLVEDVEGPLRDLEQAFIIGNAAGGSAKWKITLDDLYYVAMNGGVWESVPAGGNSFYPFTLKEKSLRQHLAPKSLWWGSGMFLCMMMAVGVASLQYHQYQAN